MHYLKPKDISGKQISVSVNKRITFNFIFRRVQVSFNQYVTISIIVTLDSRKITGKSYFLEKIFYYI